MKKLYLIATLFFLNSNHFFAGENKKNNPEDLNKEIAILDEENQILLTQLDITNEQIIKLQESNTDLWTENKNLCS